MGSLGLGLASGLWSGLVLLTVVFWTVFGVFLPAVRGAHVGPTNCPASPYFNT